MEDIDMYYNQACCDLENGKIEQALNTFLGLYEKVPNNYKVINKLGVISASRNELNCAMKYFEEVLEINPNYAPALVNIGNICKEQGQIELAENYYRYSIEIDPDYYFAQYNLAVLYKDNRKYNLYVKYIKEYKRVYKNYIYNDEIARYKSKGKKVGTIVNMFILSLFLLIVITLFNR